VPDMWLSALIYIIPFNPGISQFKLTYAAVTSNSRMSMPYKTKVYFLLTGCVSLAVTVHHILEPGLRLNK